MAGIDLSTLNECQRQIVTTLDRPVFVEAGAGSGKTFTLTRRIAWALSPGSGDNGAPFVDDLSQVLVITFTNAAAREIKERVRSALRQAGMREQALMVDSAWISTIHGMCSRILRRHALDLGIDPSFKVAGVNEARTLIAQATEEIVGAARRDRSNPVLARVFDEYNYSSASGSGFDVASMVRDLVSAAHSSPDGFDSLVSVGEPDVEGAIERLRAAIGALGAQSGITPNAREKVMASLDSIDGFLSAPPGGRTPEAASTALAGVKLPSANVKAIKELVPEAKRALDEAKLEVALAPNAPLADALIELARRVDERNLELKRENSLLENDDLISLALHAVRDNPVVAAEYRGHFKLVMVDESQDTDTSQLELIKLLSGDGALHLTTVGDAQQSIYRFRGADVSVFRARGEEVPQEDHVRLSVNYRSHAEILSFVDAVCGGPNGVVADFMHLDPNPKRDDGYNARPLPRVDVEVTLARGRMTTMASATCAAQIADRLAAYAAAGQSPSDMALLLGASKKSDLYIDALRARGLECVVTGGSSFTSAPEVQVMAALLHTLANPHDTQSGLFPLLASPMFELDANDFVQLGTRTQDMVDAPTKRAIDRGIQAMAFYGGATPSPRLKAAHEVLSRARLALRKHPVADVCLRVVRESGWLRRLEAEGTKGLAKEANALAAVRYIRELTRDLGLGPARAATEFDLWLASEKVSPASLAGGSSNQVQIMTVHASKGLEFPIVAIAECWADPRPSGAVVTGRLDARRRGIIVRPKGLKVPKDLVAEESPRGCAEWLVSLTEQNKLDEAAEKTRLLYVALTRAREALVLGVSVTVAKAGVKSGLAADVLQALVGTATPAPGESPLEYGGSEPGRLRCVSIEPCEKGVGGYTLDSAGSFFDGTVANEDEVTGIGTTVEAAAPSCFSLVSPDPDPAAPAVTMWRPRAGVFSYSSAHAQMLGDFSASNGEAPDDAGPATGPAGLPARAERDAMQKGAPVVGDADKATGLGSAFHELAQAMVEAGQRFPAPGRIAATKRFWRLSERAGARLDEALQRWWGSDVRQEALSHELVRAELPFFQRVDSAYGGYVEGAIDLLATDPDSDHALLVDYKTGDRGLGAQAIRQRHEMQANFYAHVLMGLGFASVSCRFVCVELERADAPGQPVVVAYEFDATHPPLMG
ncbi:UvrD-helicase domain-containing protein [Tractidigestivibacter sp.]|uniref:UvrD-helicase domain-containing protein n=1 Tax=Tractidigestivibacter sp. TaxID=2847320 RepID=UPI002A91FD14|nr:UvrD-helicase domain-containing protein [Tractidigestivibacter sp.]MDY5272064.1 UvrD-helicase domain-containing protein [Tractidigestivibacter sp.]